MPAKKQKKTKKPPYRIPSMKEIAKVRGTNGYKVVSTFSGCGGSCLGFEMAGYEVLWANEFVKEARISYRPNHPGVKLDNRSIRDVKVSDILEATGLKKGELDVFEGSPPCQSFSTAGKREKGWGKSAKHGDGSEQVADDLFFEYARLLKGLQPKTFVAENVSGLVKGVAKGYFKMILKKLKACGYRVKAAVLDAQWLGVPQMRRRVIFIGVRKDLGVEPVFPSPLSYRYSVAEACPTLIACSTKAHGFTKATDLSLDKPAPSVPASGACSYTGHQVMSIEGTAIGREAKKLKPGEKSDRYFQLERADPEKPSPTICASHGQRGIASVIHPTEMRKFTIAELRRICAFPDDFILKGSYSQQWARLGNSVPPLMMRAVAETLRREVLDQL